MTGRQAWDLYDQLKARGWTMQTLTAPFDGEQDGACIVGCPPGTDTPITIDSPEDAIKATA
jgi:hypothetical protein